MGLLKNDLKNKPYVRFFDQQVRVSMKNMRRCPSFAFCYTQIQS